MKKLLSASSAIALGWVVVGFSVTAEAQQPQQKPAAQAPAKGGAAPPAAAPAAPAAPAGKGAAAPAGGDPNQSAWVKLCEKANLKKGDKEESLDICLTHHERLDGNTGMVIVSAALREVQGNPKKHLMVMVPLGVALPVGLQI